MGASLGVVKIKRPILVASLGFIIGIIWGLYIKLCIVSIFIIVYIFIYIIRKNKNIKRYFDLLCIKYILIFSLFAITSNIYILFLDYRYTNLYRQINDLKLNAVVIKKLITNNF